ncbi:hypothetical protein HQ531_00480 [bacterium]|nr:hypothetical protein [bacterium]
MKKQTLILTLFLLITLTACREKIEPETDDFVEYGWTLYADRDFRGALDQFDTGMAMDSLYIDGYNGSGWCYVELNAPDSAFGYFHSGLEFITDDSSRVYFELLAGRALTYHVLEQYQLAIDDGERLYENNPVFEFRHNWRINYVDIIVMVAASYYAEGDFLSALTWVQYYDEDFSVDVSTNKGRSDLIEKIELIQNG